MNNTVWLLVLRIEKQTAFKLYPTEQACLSDVEDLSKDPQIEPHIEDTLVVELPLPETQEAIN